MPRKAITVPGAAPPVAPFSLAVEAEPFLFLSGQLGTDPATNKLVSGDLQEQCRQIFRNVEGVLAAAGKTLDNVVKVTVYLADMKDFAAMNEIYGPKFAKPHPARTCIAVAALPLGARVEMDMTAR
jgi:2-iminobutanoate/2-iminopropanoate deaminase